MPYIRKNEVLSQAEIDQLLMAISANDTEDDGEFKPAAKQKRYAIYDFARPDTFPKIVKTEISNIFQVAISQFNSIIKKTFNWNCNYYYESLDILSYETIKRWKRSDDSLYFSLWSSYSNFVEMDLSSVKQMLICLQNNTPEAMGFSLDEQYNLAVSKFGEIFSSVVNDLLPDTFKGIWLSASSQADFKGHRIDNRTSCIFATFECIPGMSFTYMLPYTPDLIKAFNIKDFSADLQIDFEMDICLYKSTTLNIKTLEALKKGDSICFSNNTYLEAFSKEPERKALFLLNDNIITKIYKKEKVMFDMESNTTSLDNLQINVVVELGRGKIPLKDIRGLTEGSILELETELGYPSKVYANNVLLGTAEILTDSDGSFAIRMIDLYNQNED